MYLKESVHHIL